MSYKDRCNNSILMGNNKIDYFKLPNPSNGLFKDSDSTLFKDYEKIAKVYTVNNCDHYLILTGKSKEDNKSKITKCTDLKTKKKTKLKIAMNSSSKKIKANTLKSIEKLKSNLTKSNIDDVACNLKYLKEILNTKDCEGGTKNYNNINEEIQHYLRTTKNEEILGIMQSYINNILKDTDINKNDIKILFKKNKNIADKFIELIKTYKTCD